MTTKRFPFQASTLCAGGTLLVLGGFLALNLAGCGGGGGGGVIAPTNSTASASLSFQLQLSDNTSATGGSITLSSAVGRTYSATANKNGIATVRGVVPGIYTLVFSVVQPNGSTLTTTRSLVISSGANSVTLIAGDTGDPTKYPFTVSGNIVQNTDANGNPVTAGVFCSPTSQPITSQILVEVDDLNSTNGTPAIAQMTLTPDPATGAYSIKIPFQPRALQVKVSTAPTDTTGAGFAGLSASTSFPLGKLIVPNVDVCTNTSANGTVTFPQPIVTDAPTATPFLTSTPIGTPIATTTSTPVFIPTATTAPTVTPTPSATTTGTPVATATSTTPTATATKASTGGTSIGG